MALLKVILIIVFIIIGIAGWSMLMINSVYGHESDGFVHSSRTGLCVRIKPCPSIGMNLWSIDSDNDKVVDGCKLVLFTHGKFHQRELPVVDGTCQCPGD